jgi:hypothetical protein
MTQDQRQFWIAQFAIRDMQVGAADAAGADAEQQLVCLRFRNRQIHRLKGFMSMLENLGVHGNLDQVAGQTGQTGECDIRIWTLACPHGMIVEFTANPAPCPSISPTSPAPNARIC